MSDIDENHARHRIDDELFERLVDFRRDLHRHPELSWEETRTAGRIKAELDRLGIEYRDKVAKTGIVATIPGKRRDRPAVALRADMDALPVVERTGLAFASEREGVMHACGHDGHTSILLGAAELLCRNAPPVDVKLIWQPAEELASGAEVMIEEGALDGVGIIFGGHVDRHYSPGTIVIAEGPVNASTDLFTIQITGREGHGARPHETIDAVVVGSLLVTSLQTIVSREVDPAHPSVVSVGRFDAGTAANVIAGSATLEGTIRCQDTEVRDFLHRSIVRISKAIADLHGAQIDVDLNLRTPPLINAPEPTYIARRATQEMEDVAIRKSLHTVNMGGEDFACYMEHVPGCYVRFGAQVEGRESFPAHSSHFDFDERAIAVGAEWMARVAHDAGTELAEQPPEESS